MTRDGAALENRATGEQERISKRDPAPVFTKPQDAQQSLTEQPQQLLKPPLPLVRGEEKQDTGTAERVLDRLDTEHTRHKSKQAIKRANKAIR